MIHPSIKKNISTDDFDEWWEQFDMSQFKPEIYLLSWLFIINFIAYICQFLYIQHVIPDYKSFPAIFHSFTTTGCLVLDLCVLTSLYCVAIPLSIITMTFVSQSDSVFFSLNPYGIIYVKDVLKTVEPEKIIYVGYTKLAMTLLDRMSCFFSLNLWTISFKYIFTADGYLSKIGNTVLTSLALFGNFCLYSLLLLVPVIPILLHCFFVFPCYFFCHVLQHKTGFRKKITILYLFFPIFILILFRHYILFVIQFVLRSIIYVVFVACPLFVNVSETASLFWVCVLSVLIYLVKYTTSFHRSYKKLLDVLLQIKKEYVFDEQTIKSSENAVVHTDRIDVEDFNTLAEKYLPLRHQLFVFFLKITLTTLFLYVTFDTINQGGNDKIASSLMPIILTVAIPALLEQLCSPSNIEDILNVHDDDIKRDFHERLKNPSSKNEGSSNAENEELSLLYFPMYYSVKVFALFLKNVIHKSKNESTVKAQECPTILTACFRKKGNNNESGEQNPLLQR